MTHLRYVIVHYVKNLTSSFVMEKWIKKNFTLWLQLLWCCRICFRFPTVYSSLQKGSKNSKTFVSFIWNKSLPWTELFFWQMQYEGFQFKKSVMKISGLTGTKKLIQNAIFVHFFVLPDCCCKVISKIFLNFPCYF